MEYTTLGNTGLRVSVAGLGCGGHSRIGMSYGKSKEEASEIVKKAIDLGVNFIDTAEAYKTEEAVGLGIGGAKRDALILCTKKSMRKDGNLISGGDLREGLEGSLRRMNTDYVDVYYLHGVRAEDYPHCCDALLPELEKLKAEGKIRHTGLTEGFGSDEGHDMLQKAAQDPRWEVVMVGFNLLNQSARERVFPGTKQNGIGTVNMFAVRRALSRPEVLKELLQSLVDEGRIDGAEVVGDDPLGFLVGPGKAESLTDAAYRFCRHEEGIDTVLFGTGNPDHLEANIASLLRPPLPEEDVERLKRMFARVDNVSGN